MKRFSLIAAMVAGVGSQVYGQAITLNNTAGQSVVEAIAAFTPNTSTVDGDVNSLPFSTASTAVQNTSISQVSPTFSSSSLGVSFTQSISGTTSSTSGEGTVFFTANGPGTYSISGGMSITGSKTAGDLSAFLYDLTTATYVYQNDQTFGGNLSLSATLDNSQVGLLSGSLTSGDVYEFDAYDSLQNRTGAQGMTGSTTITLTGLTPVPEPSTWAILVTGLGMLAGFKFFGRKNKVVAQS